MMDDVAEIGRQQIIEYMKKKKTPKEKNEEKGNQIPKGGKSGILMRAYERGNAVFWTGFIKLDSKYVLSS